MDTSKIEAIPQVSHYGTIRIGHLAIDCVVLDDDAHTHGYIQKQLNQAVGVSFGRGSQGRDFLAKFAPNYLNSVNNSDVVNAVKMPTRGYANIYLAGILSELPMNVIKAALNGTLHHKQKHIVPHCVAIAEALAKTGEIALIDEATGYQFVRADNYLNDFFTLVLRERFADWERRFPPSFYDALFEMLGMQRDGNKSPLIIARITADWVYGVVFPLAVIAEMRKRRDAAGTKLHQWLQDGGLSLLEKQINAVTMIARSSIDRDDFRARCAAAFMNREQQRMFFNGGAA